MFLMRVLSSTLLNYSTLHTKLTFCFAQTNKSNINIFIVFNASRFSLRSLSNDAHDASLKCEENAGQTLRIFRALA